MQKNYYSSGRAYEPIDVINDWGLNFNLGNVVKYISRHGRKGTRGNEIEDLNKAIDYLIYEKEWLLSKYEQEDCELKGEVYEETNLH